MPWITPVTNRTSGKARMTYIDMNRISGNVSYLYNYALEHGYEVEGGDVVKTSWTQNDIVTVSEWESIQSVLSAVRNAAGLWVVSYTPVYYYSMNMFESYTLDTYRHITEPSEYELLHTRDSIQIQNENGVDLEAGIL